MPFNFATAFNRFFQLLSQNAALFLGLGLVGVALPSAACIYGLNHFYDLTGTSQEELLRSVTDKNGLAVFAVVIGLGILKIINLSMVTEAAILRGAGKKIEVGALLGHAFANIIPLIGVTILVSLIVVGGLVLLVVPGIIWLLATYVAVPAYIGQPGLGVGGAISRSFELTRGNRWWLLLLIIVGALMAGAVSAAWEEAAIGLSQYSLPVLIGGSGFDSLTDVLANVFIAAMYVALRESRDGLVPERAASVFQ